MSKKKKDLKLKAPDALQVRTASLVSSMRQHPQLLVGILVGLLVIIGAGIGINVLMEQQHEELRQNLADIDQQYESEQETVAEQRSELEEQLDDLKLQEKKAKGEEKEQLSQDIAELEAQLDQLKPDHTASKQEFRNFFDQHPAEPEGWIAGIRYASMAIEERELAEAREVLTKIADQSGDYLIVQVQSRLLLVSVLEDLGEFDEALQHVAALDKNVNDELKPTVLLAKGRLHVFKEEYDQARQAFDQLIQDHGSAREAQQAKNLKALLH
jgi:predicted negative regulator of RcsB-dependent stress response